MSEIITITEGKPGGEIGRCCGNVIDPVTIPVASVIDTSPIVLPLGTPFIKVPIVIAEKTIQIDVEATIKLDRDAMEIKRIRKNIFLTQCRLIPRGGFTPNTGKLFIKGYVRKNIEYATACCPGKGGISGEIRHTTVKVPFQCVVPITYITPPTFTNNINPTEIETFSPCNMGRDLGQQDFESTEYFNEKVYCELVSCRFNEADIQCHGDSIDEYYDLETKFDKLTEKLVIHLTFKLLQLQQVRIGSLG